MTFGLTHAFMAADDEIVNVAVDSYQLHALHDRIGTLLHRDRRVWHAPAQTSRACLPDKSCAAAAATLSGRQDQPDCGSQAASYDG